MPLAKLGGYFYVDSCIDLSCYAPEPVPQQTVEPQPTSVTTRVNTGAIDILTMVGKHSGLDAAVRAAYPDGGIADKILSIARYLVATGGDTIHNIDVWQYDHDLPYEFGMSEDVCYDLFESLGYDSTGEQRLFERLSAIGGPDQQVMAFDSTTVSTYVDGLKPMARQGYNKDGDGLDTFKLLSFFSLTNQLPVMMDLQPGNIPGRRVSAQCDQASQNLRIEKARTCSGQRLLQ